MGKIKSLYQYPRIAYGKLYILASEDVSMSKKSVIGRAVVLIVVVAIVMRHRKVWSEKPIDTTASNIREITINRGNVTCELPIDKQDEFLAILDRMRFKRHEIDTGELGGVLEQRPGTFYIIGLYYKDGKYTYFSINTDAKCIRISDNTGVIYYYKRYNEKAVDEIFKSLNN